MLCIRTAQEVSNLVPDSVTVEPQSLSPQPSRFLDLPPAPKYRVNDAVHSVNLLYRYKPSVAHSTTATAQPPTGPSPTKHTLTRAHIHTHTCSQSHTHTHTRVWYRPVFFFLSLLPPPPPLPFIPRPLPSAEMNPKSRPFRVELYVCQFTFPANSGWISLSN